MNNMQIGALKQNKKYLVIIPVLLVTAVLPLILRLKVLELDAGMQALWNGDRSVGDVFSYFKMSFLLICSIFLCLGFIVNRGHLKKAKRDKAILLLGIYAGLIVLSTVFSDYREIALFGFVGRFEGMFVLVSYAILAIGCIVYVSSEGEVGLLYKALSVSASIIGLISLLQHLGFDIFRLALVQKMIIPSEFRGLANAIFNFKTHAVYATLQNPNYVGSYMAMLFPIGTTLYLTSPGRVSRVLYGLLSCLTFLALLGSLSRAGIIGALVSIGLLALFLRKRLKAHSVRLITIALCLIAAFVMTNYLVEFKLLEGSTQYLANRNMEKKASTAVIENIELRNDSIKINANETELCIELRGSQLVFLDQGLKELSVIRNGETVTFADQEYKQYTIILPAKGGIIRVEIDKLEISFAYTQNAGFRVIKGNGTLAAVDYPERVGFGNNEKFASSRGYIWSRTIPLLKHTLILGKGPDTFAAYFPQNDFIGKLNTFKTIDVVIDKPHSMYLQTAFNTGVASLIVLLLFFAFYIKDSFGIYSKCNFDNTLEIYGLCSFLAVCAYLIAGVFNDSVISVAPVFWVIIGLGIAVNKQLKLKLIRG